MYKLSTIAVTGPDAFEFLQGQLTNDLRRLGAEAEILAAWCNPKGRVIWFGTVWPIEQGYGLSAPAETAADVVKRLTMFRFRSKVEFETVDEGATVDPAFLIQHGNAFIGPEQVEQFTPHMLNLDLLDAISLDKGCYTGQEIVARTHYKGATKRRTQRFESETPVAIGAKISDGNRDVGEVLNVSGTDLLAVVPVDKADAGLTVNGIELQRQPLPYGD
ncbi:MAG: YgfZ/GcvT domain-containing protein [Woeseiaceae bacterium]